MNKYTFKLHKKGEQTIGYHWVDAIDQNLEEQISDLVKIVSADTPVVGFSTNITAKEMADYCNNLRKNLKEQSLRLLVIESEVDGVVGLCNIRLNQNPNNKHIADLSKGMISPEHRGSGILAAAFCEISRQCERDGVEIVTLDVREKTAAEVIWQNFGFVIYGTLPDYSRSEGISYTGYYMHQPVKKLKQKADRIVKIKAIDHPS